MTSVPVTPCIRQLLDAEKIAAEKVAEAKKHRERKLKLAKTEALAEIEQYRQEREREFQNFENKHAALRAKITARIDMETRKKLDIMRSTVTRNRKSMIEKILELVFKIPEY
ncbi:V-type proton ATPase subunit G-like [Nilaparvata lugens]|uniref:V-type proton ATPase subunit G-like n=1 Tax=Nilaparvata lugens TaxID=108931 RepID=UPI00193DED99|nr:V-type proton ATPase subunit G-like [Nilaparvata lugens]